MNSDTVRFCGGVRTRFMTVACKSLRVTVTRAEDSRLPSVEHHFTCFACETMLLIACVIPWMFFPPFHAAFVRTESLSGSGGLPDDFVTLIAVKLVRAVPLSIEELLHGPVCETDNFADFQICKSLSAVFDQLLFLVAHYEKDLLDAFL